MATQYGKSLTLKTNDGDRVITDKTKATAILKRLDSNPRLFSMTADDGSVEYFNLSAESCVFCVVATYTTSNKEVANTPCEDALPAECPTDTTTTAETLPAGGK